MMRYLSVCSGIEAASCAWHPLGWEPVAFSEIEAFPSAVLAHHYPDTPNWGDMTRLKEWPDADVDVLVGGTPCQSFSVAGLRKGLDDPRGNLMLTYLAIAAKYRPTWLVWENVPGVLSSNGGRDFGTFLGGLGELGYGFAYRVLDAQYFGVAQRRRRVFVVGCLGDWRRAAAVLFERHSMQGHPAPQRQARERPAGRAEPSAAISSGHGWWSDSDVGATVRAQDSVTKADTLIPVPHADISPALKARDSKGPSSDGDGDGDGAILVPMVAHSLRGEGFDASEDGTGRETPLVPVAIRTAQTSANGHGISEGLAHTLDQAQGQCVAFAQNQRDEVRTVAVAGALAAEPGMKQQTYIASAVAIQAGATRENPDSGPDGVGVRTDDCAYTIEARAEVQAVQVAMQVRRLTPRECERLQGFPDDYTLITVRGKPAADGPRYKALGNSMAVPCMAWIGERIQMLETIKEK